MPTKPNKTADHLLSPAFSERKKIEATTREEGIELFKQNEIKKEGLGTILFKKNWHQGIVGLVASKVKDITTSPTIAFAYQNQESKLLKGANARKV